MCTSTKLFYLSCHQKQLFSIYYPPDKGMQDRGDILFVHAFAEEMNKARHMVTKQARAFQKKGLGVLIIDLAGCGDSEGDFNEARWSIWLDNIHTALSWILGKNRKFFALWGMRLGCLLIMDFVKQKKIVPEKFIFWQPVIRGDIAMAQFLRIHTASLLTGTANISVKDLKNSMKDGCSVEIAGYEIHPELFFAIESIKMSDFNPPLESRIFWFEIVLSEDSSINLSSRSIIDSWKASRIKIDLDSIVGQPFWSTVELSSVYELIDKTAEIIDG